MDPRSLIQGDYMDLRFRLGLSVDKEDGYVVVSLDERNIGSFKRLYKDQALSQDEILIRYRVRNDTVKFATIRDRRVRASRTATLAWSGSRS